MSITKQDLLAIRQLLIEEINGVAQFARQTIDEPGPNAESILRARALLARWEERLAWIDDQIHRLDTAAARAERIMNIRMFRILIRQKINLAKARPERFIKSPETAESDFQAFLLSLEELFERRSP